MFDRTSILYGLCRHLIQQGQLTERAWLQIQEQHRSSDEELDELILASGHIDEDTLLEGIAKAIGCRYWQGRTLFEKYKKKPLPALPLSLDFFAHKGILPLSWETSIGTLHLVMSRLPAQDLLEQLRSLLPISKLHLELAPKDATSLVLNIWTKQSSKVTTVLDVPNAVDLASFLVGEALAPEEELSATKSPAKTQPIASLADALTSLDPAVAPTQNAAAFTVAPPGLENTGALGSMRHSGADSEGDIDRTYAILPIVPTNATVPSAPVRRVVQNSPTLAAAAPVAYPSQPQPLEPPSWQDEVLQPHTDATHLMAPPLGGRTPGDRLPNGRLPSGDLTFASHAPVDRLPSGDLTYQSGAVPLKDGASAPPQFDDSEFFLDYQNPTTPAINATSAYVPLDEDREPALPTARGNTKFNEFLDEWDEPKATVPPVPAAAKPVLDLFEVIEETKPPAPKPAAPATPAPQAKPTPKPSLSPGTSILPSDEELFGRGLGAMNTKQIPEPSRRPSNLGPPAPQITIGTSRRAPAKSKSKPKFSIEDFLLRYVLGGTVGAVNLIVRLGVLTTIGYLVWYLFLSQ